MVSTQTVRNQLAERGFRNLVRWQRGVDTELFAPGAKDFLQLPRPIATYIGRVAIEKNIDAFLRMPWHGTKLVIGDGPELPRLKSQFPNAVYAGFRFGEDLAQHLAASDVFVFPSLTDTFGLVNLEAMACGIPVAAFPVAGPIDVVEDGVTGALDEDLARAALRAMTIDPQKCRDRALRSSWESCSREFESNLVPAHGHRPARCVSVPPAFRQPAG
jgi:glycosyltransferase involved in cell wall biosynthesis